MVQMLQGQQDFVEDVVSAVESLAADLHTCQVQPAVPHTLLSPRSHGPSQDKFGYGILA